MIFIWYGNVYTYASQLINYSYCLVFFLRLSVIYIMYSLLPTDISLKWEEERGKKKKGRITNVSLTLTTKEWKRKNFIIWANDRKCEARRQRETQNEDVFFFWPTSVSCLCHWKKHKEASLWTILSIKHMHTHTQTHARRHAHWPHIS